MCAADYKWPSSRRVSSECKDLVSKILVVDASKRITVQGIQVRHMAAHVLTSPAQAACMQCTDPQDSCMPRWHAQHLDIQTMLASVSDSCACSWSVCERHNCAHACKAP